jgi:hypothetical protein
MVDEKRIHLLTHALFDDGKSCRDGKTDTMDLPLPFDLKPVRTVVAKIEFCKELFEVGRKIL